jgi:hypothetical protein
METIVQVELWNGLSDAVTEALITCRWDGRNAELSLGAPDAHLSLEATARDAFDALQRVRLQLEPLDWYPLCNGARVDCYPSGMARGMGGALTVYVLAVGRSARPPLVGLFEPAAREQVGPVADQDAHYERWIATPKS